MPKPNYGRPNNKFIIVVMAGCLILYYSIDIFRFLPSPFNSIYIYVFFPLLILLVFYSLSLIAYIFWGRYRFRNSILNLYNWRGNEQVLYIGNTLELLMIGAAKKLTTGTCTGINLYTAVNKEKTLAHIKNNAAIEGVADKIDLTDERIPGSSFADESFDVIFSIMELTKFNKNADLQVVAAEMGRLLKNNGKAIIADIRRPGKLWKAFHKQGLHTQIAGNYLFTALLPLRVMIVTKGDRPAPLIRTANKKQRNIILISLGALMLIIISFFMIKAVKKISTVAWDFSPPSTYVIPAEDSALIAKKYWDKLKVDEIIQSNHRGPISQLIFDTGYYLDIYKIPLAPNTQTNLLYVKRKRLDQRTWVAYNIRRGPSFSLETKEGDFNRPTNIYVTLGGDSLSTIVKNDSIISYHLFCHDFSIRYVKKGPVDLYFEGRGDVSEPTSSSPVSLDILFLRRGNAVYLMFMTPADAGRPVPPWLLYNIVTGK